MTSIRIIPALLLSHGGLYKTRRFKKPVYLGDPINTVKIFNEKEVDEVLFLDITATRERRPIDMEMIGWLSTECFMPMAYGGGVKTIDDMARIYDVGVEKVSLNTAATEDLDLVAAAADRFGSQSVVVSIDVKRNRFGRAEVYTHGGRKNARLDPLAHARAAVEAGAGEILVTSIDRDGTGTGYDLDMIQRVAASVSVPVVANGGASSLTHFNEAVDAGAAAVAAGSMFVFEGRNRAVLITYPSPQERQAVGLGLP